MDANGAPATTPSPLLASALIFTVECLAGTDDIPSNDVDAFHALFVKHRKISLAVATLVARHDLDCTPESSWATWLEQLRALAATPLP